MEIICLRRKLSIPITSAQLEKFWQMPCWDLHGSQQTGGGVEICKSQESSYLTGCQQVIKICPSAHLLHPPQNAATRPSLQVNEGLAECQDGPRCATTRPPLRCRKVRRALLPLVSSITIGTRPLQNTQSPDPCFLWIFKTKCKKTAATQPSRCLNWHIFNTFESNFKHLYCFSNTRFA